MNDAVVLVRVTEPATIDALLVIDQESFSHPWSRQMYQDDLRNPHAQIWAAQLPDGAIVGYCAIWFVLDELHINNVAVRRAWRGSGIGETLVRHVLSLGARSGSSCALLEVRRSNGAARRLYERVGFAEAGLRKGYYQDPPDDALLLRMAIQAVGPGSGA